MTTCDQCGMPVEHGNTGTVCMACTAQLLGAKPAGQNLGQHLLMLGQPQKVSAMTDRTVIVGYTVPVSVTINIDSGEIESVKVLGQDVAPDGKLYDPASGNEVMEAVVPPKFSSPEEADAWLESRPPVPEGAVVMEQKEIEIAKDIAANSEWPSWDID